MNFNDRVAASQIAINMFDAWCKQCGIAFGKSGYENWGDDKFKERIRRLDDITSKRIRFFPDRTILGEKGAQLIEIKNSKTIEKDAYDTYMDLYRTQYNVGIVFRLEENHIEHGLSLVYLLYCSINDLQAKIPDERYITKDGIKLPIENDVWIAPRKLTEQDYRKWKNAHSGSGTTYALVDFKTTKWKVLWDEIENGELGVPIR